MISNTTHEKDEILLGQSTYDNTKDQTADFTLPAEDTEIYMISELVPFRSKLWKSRFQSLAKMVYDVNNMSPYADNIDCIINPSYVECYDNAIFTSEDIDKSAIQIKINAK